VWTNAKITFESASFFLFRRRVLDLPDKKNRGEDAFRILDEKSPQKLKFGAKQPVFDGFGHIFPFIVQFPDIKVNGKNGEVHHHFVIFCAEMPESYYPNSPETVLVVLDCIP
jgi:hypothetical protein